VAGCSSTVDCGDLGPEGLTFVSASDGPSGVALLIVSNEVSSTTTIWQVE
jgi:2',3'-cyclic-nucleotide 2'-phosphodiesterase / 3'-nucleotidase / 5'-nucleotidase